MLVLLSLLQGRRDWPGQRLAERLEVSERTVRRDIDRLRDLGYRIRAIKGPDGGYRLEAGSELPPLLFDDQQAVVLALALQSIDVTGTGFEEAAMRALTTVRQLMPSRLRHRVDAVRVTSLPTSGAEPINADTVVTLGAAIRAGEIVRFEYWGAEASARHVEPHHLATRGGRWYLIAWDLDRDDWRTFRVDRITPRAPTSRRFVPRELPGGDVSTFLAGHFTGTAGARSWPCEGQVIFSAAASSVAPFVGDGIVEEIGPDRCKVTLGSWSWAGLAASLGRFDADLEVIGPPDLATAFDDLARRFARAAGS
jgi:predicted DNA-binding transcriptional regulator YafY